MSEIEVISIAIASIVVIGIAAQWIAWRFSVPSILLLLLSGLIAGPVTGLIGPQFYDTLGDLLTPIVSLAVALILFEGGLTLHLAELPKVGGVVRNLCTFGALVTWVVGSLAACLLFPDLGWRLSILLGAVLVVTGPTVIGPLLRHIRPSGAVSPILKWEGIVIDPIGALLAVLVFEAIVSGEPGAAGEHIALGLLKTVTVGGGLGLLGAWLLTLLLARYWIPDFLQNAVSLMLVVAAFTASNVVQHESGLLAVTVMGMALANQKKVDVKHIVEFKENLRVLLISGLFILLAARLDLNDLAKVWLPGVAFVAVLVFVARPLTVWLSTAKSELKRGERIFLAWMAPRGIVAAAIASVFALRLEQHEEFAQQAGMLVPITFIVVIGTVALYGLTAPIAARRLKIAEPNPQGLLIVGASRWSRELAKLLQDKGFRVVLVDSNRDSIAPARMAGIPTWTGSILAEHAMKEIELGGIGRLIAVTPNDWVNALAVQRYKSIFGTARCYQLPPRGDSPQKKALHKHLHGRWLFSEKASYGVLEGRVGRGATIKATPLGEEFDYDAFCEHYSGDVMPMLVITSDNKLDVIVAGDQVSPKPGQTLVSLVFEPVEADGAST